MAVQVEGVTDDVGDFRRGISVESDDAVGVQGSASKVGQDFSYRSVGEVVGPGGERPVSVQEAARVEGRDGVVAVQGPGSAGCDVGSRSVVDPISGSAHEGSAVGNVQGRDAGQLAIQVEDATVDVGDLHAGVAIESNGSRSAVESPGSKVGARCRDGAVTQVVGGCGEDADTIEESARVKGFNGVIAAEHPSSAILHVDRGGVAVDPIGAAAHQSGTVADVDRSGGIDEETIQGQRAALDVDSIDVDGGVVRSNGRVVCGSADKDLPVAGQLWVLPAEVLEIGAVQGDVTIHEIDGTLSHDEGA